MKKVDIVITTYNRLAFLKLVFECIETQNNPEHYKYIIADAGSTDGTQEYLQKKFANINDSVLLMHSNKGVPMPLQDVWQMCMPAIEQSTAEEFVMCDDDVLCYGKNFIQELRSVLYEYNYDVIAPRSPNITNTSFLNRPYLLENGMFLRPSLIGTHYRLHRKKRTLDVLKGSFGPTRRETWICRKLMSAGLQFRFYLPLPVFDIGRPQSYSAKTPLPDNHFQIVNAREFLKTGWSKLYGPEKILKWDKLRGININGQTTY